MTTPQVRCTVGRLDANQKLLSNDAWCYLMLPDVRHSSSVNRLIFKLIIYEFSWGGFDSTRLVELNQRGAETEIQLLRKRFPDSTFQCLFPNPNLLVWKGIPPPKTCTNFPGIDRCLMVTKQNFLKMEGSVRHYDQTRGPKMLLKVYFLPDAVWKQLSLPLINLGRKWTLCWWWSCVMNEALVLSGNWTTTLHHSSAWSIQFWSPCTLHYITLSAFQTPPTPKVTSGASTITC